MAEPMQADPEPSPCSSGHPQETIHCMQESPAPSPCMEHAASPCRHVQFNEARIVGTVMPCSHMSQAEKEEIWYSNSSLDKFKNQVRYMCRKLRDCPQSEAAALADTPQAPIEVMSTPDAAADDDATEATGEATSSRGLEHRVCRKRLRNKHLALRCVLKAQMRSSCPDFIANISSKCTFWAKEIARNEGSRDFQAAYSTAEDLNASVASMDISAGGSTATESSAACHSAGVVKPKEKKCIIMSRLCPNKRGLSFDSDCSRPRKNCRFSGNNCNGGGLKSIFMPKKDCGAPKDKR
ncbi:MAG: hypothetical protein SGBAC_012546 [Bacillariaceae sp.]